MDTYEYQKYGEDSVMVLLEQYGQRKTAVTLDGEEYEKWDWCLVKSKLNGKH